MNSSAPEARFSPWVELNGRFISVDQAAVPVADVGLLYGIGLFETMRTYNGKVFRLDQHLQRITASAQVLDLPLDPQWLPDAPRLAELLERNQLQDARIRLTVTGGVPAAGAPARPTVLVTAVPVQDYPADYYKKGVSVLVSRHMQPGFGPLAGHKTTCYWPRLQALHEAQRRQCAEALWFTASRELAEGCISNVFVVRKQAVLTPPVGTPVLPGIARGAVLELCAREGLEHREQTLTINDLLDADEVFITNCMMQIAPVCRVERKAIGNESVGPVTRRLMDAYAGLVRATC